MGDQHQRFDQDQRIEIQVDESLIDDRIPIEIYVFMAIFCLAGVSAYLWFTT